MSRYIEGDGEENFPNESELWLANAQRALKGKRGRKVLADLREALLNLSAKRLIEGALCTVNVERRIEAEATPHLAMPNARDWHGESLRENVQRNEGEGVCAIGAYLWWRKVKAGANPVEAFDELPTLLDDDYGLEATAQLAKLEADVVYSLAWELAYRNDETYRALTPEGRYSCFMDWLDKELADV